MSDYTLISYSVCTDAEHYIIPVQLQFCLLNEGKPKKNKRGFLGWMYIRELQWSDN